MRIIVYEISQHQIGIAFRRDVLHHKRVSLQNRRILIVDDLFGHSDCGRDSFVLCARTVKWKSAKKMTMMINVPLFV